MCRRYLRHGPQDAICAGPGASAAERETVRKALLRFDPQQDLGVPYVGHTQRLTGFSPPQDGMYDTLENIVQTESVIPTEPGSNRGR